MFPLNWNIPFIRKNGSRTTLGAITGDIAGIEEDVDDLTTQTSALWATIGQNGAKNKIPLTLENLKAANTGGVWEGNVCTVTDVTYTVNTDSNGFVTSIVANGRATANRNFTANVTLPVGSYIGNGCPEGGSDNSYRIAFYNQTAGSTQIDTGNGIDLSPNEDSTYLVHMQIRNGYTANNVTFKPMIRLASDLDPTFRPYAKTNRELTEELAITDHWSEAKVAGKNYYSGSYLKKYGAIISLSFSVSDELPASTDTKVLELPAGCRPAGNFIVPAYVNGVVNGSAWIRANGNVEINPTTAGTYLGFTTTFIATQ